MAHRILRHGRGPAVNGVKHRQGIHTHDVAQFTTGDFEQCVVALIQRFPGHEAAHHHIAVGNTVVELPLYPRAGLHVFALTLGDEKTMAIQRMPDVSALVSEGKRQRRCVGYAV